MPAASTVRRSCISPQRPRVAGARSAVERLRVSARSCSCSETSDTTWFVRRFTRPGGSARAPASAARTPSASSSAARASSRRASGTTSLFCASAAALISRKRCSQLALSCWTSATFPPRSSLALDLLAERAEARRARRGRRRERRRAMPTRRVRSPSGPKNARERVGRQQEKRHKKCRCRQTLRSIGSGRTTLLRPAAAGQGAPRSKTCCERTFRAPSATSGSTAPGCYRWSSRGEEDAHASPRRGPSRRRSARGRPSEGRSTDNRQQVDAHRASPPRASSDWPPSSPSSR